MSTPTETEIAEIVADLREMAQETNLLADAAPMSAAADLIERLAAQVLPDRPAMLVSDAVTMATTVTELAMEGRTLIDGTVYEVWYELEAERMLDEAPPGSMAGKVIWNRALVPVAAGTAPTPDDPRENDPGVGE